MLESFNISDNSHEQVEIKPIVINENLKSTDSIDKSSITFKNTTKYNKFVNNKNINIAVTGVDSRLGSNYKHADANHILSFDPISKKLTIISVPRDTETQFDMNDTTIYKLAQLRGAKGRKIYLEEFCRIAEIHKINHYVEFGFSQARGILEWLGYKDSGSTLQLLRSRKVLKGDDFQRHYSQADFIKQMLVNHFGKLNSYLRGTILAGGLSIVDTDLDRKKAEYIYLQLYHSGFPDDYEIEIKIVPDPKIKYQDVDFSDMDNLEILINKIETHNLRKYDSLSSQLDVDTKVIQLLSENIVKAEIDMSRNPTLVINRLKVFFEQKAWLQITDIDKRAIYRTKVSELLANAYIKKGQNTKAKKVLNAIENERKMMKRMEEKATYLDSMNNIKKITKVNK